MEIAILDDWSGTRRTLECFGKPSPRRSSLADIVDQVVAYAAGHSIHVVDDAPLRIHPS